jgi:hypothetical protein
MKLTALLIFSFLTICAYQTVFAQQTDTSKLDCGQILTEINKDSTGLIIDYFEKAPEIKGGIKKLDKLLIYQDSTERNKYKGKVYLGFWVAASGQKECITVMRGNDWNTNQEALRLLSQLNFEPATQNGKPIAVVYHLAIDFDKATVTKEKRK